MNGKVWIVLFFPSIAAAAPIVSPSTATVILGGVVQFTSTDTITCAMASGSIGTVDSGTCLYTAPSSTNAFTPHNQQNGCQVLPEDHIFHADISGLSAHANSSARMNQLKSVIATETGGDGYIDLGWDIGMPRNVYSSASPTENLVCRYTHENDGNYPLYSFPTRMQEGSNLPNSYGVGGTVQDHHVLGISTETCHIYELYQPYPAGTDPDRPLNNMDSCVQYGNMSYVLPDVTNGGGGGADAAGMYILPLLITGEELQAGVINHALRMTMRNDAIRSGVFIWPAVAAANPGNCVDTTNCFPYGARLRLKSSFAIKSSLSPQAKAIYTALKKYGAFIVDGGLPGHITMSAEATASTATWNAIWSELATSSITFQTDMEQVDESALMVSSNTAQVKLGAGVTPDRYAEVIVTKTSDSSTTRKRVAIQTPTAGTYNPAFQGMQNTLSVMAGTPQFQIPAYVRGSTDSVATCTMSPTVGTLSSDCMYTAPTNQYNQILVTTVTIKSRISPTTGSTSFPLVVFSSDAIRVKSGPLSGSCTQPPCTADGDFVDTTGNKWFNDPISTMPNFYTRDTQGVASWPADAENRELYSGINYGSGDKFWSAKVPNGTYQLKTMHGIGTNFASDVNTSTCSLQVKGTIFSNSQPLSTATFTPKVHITTVTVSDNNFQWGIIGNDEGSHSFISGWSLMPISLNTESSKLRGQAKLRGAAKLR